MPYTDPKTKLLYPSYEWMVANIKNLPEVQKAYPELMLTPASAPTVKAPISAGPTTLAPGELQAGAAKDPATAIENIYYPGGYSGVSIVDYLASVGQPSDFALRAKLAKQQGIANYTGTATQNTQLLNLLRGGAAPTPAPTPTPTPAPTVDIAGMQQQAKDLQEQISKLTQVSQAAEAAGYGAGTGKEIPAELFEQVGITPDTFDVSDNEVIDFTKDSTADLTAMISSWGETMKEIEEKNAQTTQDYLDWQKEEKEKTKKWYEGIITGFQEKAEERPSARELLETTLADYGFTPETFQEQKDLISKVTAIQLQIADIDVATAAKIGMAESRGMPMEYIRGEKALINRQAASEKAGLAAKATAYAAQSEMLRGNMNQALTMATTVVNAATQDYQQEVNDFKFLMDMQGDLINALSDADRNMFETVFAYNENMLNLKRAEETQKMNLVIDAAGKGIILPYTPDMTLQEMTELYSKSVAPVVAAEEAVGITTERKQIISQINSAVDQYRLNPEGFRERFVNSLVATYGEDQREYITEQVYSLMPDIRGGERFLTIDWFRNTINFDELLRATYEGREKELEKLGVAERVGFKTTYLKDLMGKVEAYRQAGYTDQEILALMK